jgi:hypothetical protein
MSKPTLELMTPWERDAYNEGFRAGVEAAAKWLTDTDFFEEGDAECLRVNVLPPAAQPRGEP